MNAIFALVWACLSATALVGPLPQTASLVSDEEVVTIESLARNFQAKLDEAEYLSVRAEHRYMSYEIRLSGKGEEEEILNIPLSLNVTVESKMTRGSVASTFSREDVKNPIISLSINPDVATAEYYYWNLPEPITRTFTKNLADLTDDFVYDTPEEDLLLEGFWCQCEGAAFWRTWLPSSHNYWNWEKILVQGELDEEPVIYNGKPAWRIVLPEPGIKVGDGGTDYFYIDRESGLLVGREKYIIRVVREKGEKEGKERVSAFHTADISFSYDFAQTVSSQTSE